MRGPDGLAAAGGARRDDDRRHRAGPGSASGTGAGCRGTAASRWPGRRTRRPSPRPSPKPRVDEAHDAGAARLRLDEPLEGERCARWPAGRRRRSGAAAPTRSPSPCSTMPGPKVSSMRAADALVDLGGHEPGGDAGARWRSPARPPRACRAPRPRGARTRVARTLGRRSSEASSASGGRLAGRGWAATTRRCQRPPSARLVVVAGDEAGDGGGELLGEGGALGRRAEADLGVDAPASAAAARRRRRGARARRPRAPRGPRGRPGSARRGGRRCAPGSVAACAQRAGRDDVRRGGRAPAAARSARPTGASPATRTSPCCSSARRW